MHIYIGIYMTSSHLKWWYQAEKGRLYRYTGSSSTAGGRLHPSLVLIGVVLDALLNVLHRGVRVHVKFMLVRGAVEQRGGRDRHCTCTAAQS